MAKSTTPQPLQYAAASLYQWHLDNSPLEQTADVIHQWLSSANKQSPLSIEDIKQSLIRSRAQDDFQKKQQALIKRWQKAFTACNDLPNSTLAKDFLNDWVESQDHSLIFGNHLFSGHSHIIANKLGDTVNFLYNSRNFWTLHLTLKGSARYTSDYDIETSAGDIVLIEPNARCHFQRHPDHPVWEHAWIIFQPRDDWSQWLLQPKLAEGIRHLTLDNAELAQDVNQLLAQINNLNYGNERIDTALGMNFLEQILIKVTHAIPADSVPNLDPRVEQACSILRENIGKNITVKDIAERCHTSPSRIAHLFKQDMGVGLQQFRNRLRMQFARELLLTTQISIETIAAKSGYTDPTQFSKYFRKHNDCSPRTFRQQNAQEK